MMIVSLLWTVVFCLCFDFSLVLVNRWLKSECSWVFFRLRTLIWIEDINLLHNGTMIWNTHLRSVCGLNFVQQVDALVLYIQWGAKAHEHASWVTWDQPREHVVHGHYMLDGTPHTFKNWRKHYANPYTFTTENTNDHMYCLPNKHQA